MALSIDTGYPLKGATYNSTTYPSMGMFDCIRDRYGVFWIAGYYRLSTETYVHPCLHKLTANYMSSSLIDVPNTLWGAPALQSTHVYVTSLCIDDDGLIHMVGRYKAAAGQNNDHIWYARYNPVNESWDQNPERVDTDNPTSNDEDQGYSVRDITCSLNGQNEVGIAWEGIGYDTGAATKIRIISRIYYKSAGTWTRSSVKLIPVTTSNVYAEFGVKLAEDSQNSDSFIIVYQYEKAGNDAIVQRRLVLSGTDVGVYTHGTTRTDMTVPRFDVAGPRSLIEKLTGSGTGHYGYTQLTTSNFSYMGGEDSAYTQVQNIDLRIRGVHRDNGEGLLYTYGNISDNKMYMQECTDWPNKTHAAAVKIADVRMGYTAGPKFYYPQVGGKRHNTMANGIMFMSLTKNDVLGGGETDYAFYIWHINNAYFSEPEGAINYIYKLFNGNWSTPTNVASGEKPQISLSQDGYAYVTYLSDTDLKSTRKDITVSGAPWDADWTAATGVLNFQTQWAYYPRDSVGSYNEPMWGVSSIIEKGSVYYLKIDGVELYTPSGTW